jgi:hypothetical protein
VSCEEDAALLDRLGKLDLLLTWLWRVHGIDYYAGKELLQEGEYEARLDRARTIRGPRPEEGEEQDEAEGEFTFDCWWWGPWRFCYTALRQHLASLQLVLRQPCMLCAPRVRLSAWRVRTLCLTVLPLCACCVRLPCVPAAAKAEMAELAEQVDKVWAERLRQPDPLLQGCQRAEVRWAGWGGAGSVVLCCAVQGCSRPGCWLVWQQEHCEA